MRFLVVLVVVSLVGCDDPVQPREQGLYEVVTLRTLPEGTEVSFGHDIWPPSDSRADLNENGQALWYEDGQSILWDNGQVVEVPVGKFLGSSGEVLGDSSVWIEGQLTDLTGLTRGITEDGAIYFSRNDTMFTWKDGSVEPTDLPPIGTVGPEARVYRTVYVEDASGCQVFENGEWNRLPSQSQFCEFVMAEENGWVLLIGGGRGGEFGWLVTPDGSTVTPGLETGELIHVNSHGEALSREGDLLLADTTLHLSKVFGFEPSIFKGGAINDDGDILAQLDNRVVLLTPR